MAKIKTVNFKKERKPTIKHLAIIILKKQLVGEKLCATPTIYKFLIIISNMICI
jgi:hypothetical protein